MNGIKNCPITLEDIDIAEKIFGKDIYTLKGKSTRTRPIPVIQDYVEIPKELKKFIKISNYVLILCIFRELCFL